MTLSMRVFIYNNCLPVFATLPQTSFTILRRFRVKFYKNAPGHQYAHCTIERLTRFILHNSFTGIPTCASVYKHCTIVS